MKLAGYALALLLVAHASGQHTVKDEQPCAVEGQVVQVATGGPLKSVRLTLVQVGISSKPRTYKAVSNASGNFSFKGVLPGIYQFVARRNGYMPQRYRPEGAGEAGSMLELAAGEKLTKVLFNLVAAAAIVGRITDEDGEPVAGVEVEALIKHSLADDDQPATAKKQQFIPLGMAVTNDLGEYRVHGLPAGSYYVAAIDSGMPELTEHTLRTGSVGFSVDNEPETSHPPIYYPGVAQRSQAQKVAVRSGQEIRIDFALHPETTAVVSGRLLDEKGKPASGESVALEPRELDTLFSSLRLSSAADAQGSFAIKGVSPGSYLLQSATTDEKGSFSVRQAVEVAADDISNLELRLARLSSLAGRLTVPDGSKIEFEALHVWLSTADDDMSFGVANVRPDRTFTVEQLDAGTYGIKINGLPDGWYLKSASFEGDDVLRHGIKVGNGKNTGTLDLRVSRGAAQLSGSVTENEKTVAGAAVKLVPQEENLYRKDLVYSAIADQHGNFVFKSIVPGNYRLLANLSEDELTEDDSAADLSPVAEEKIVLADNEGKTINLQIRKTSQSPK
jgi:hypothetical protein